MHDRHHLRERRLKLGASQSLIGHLAEFRASSAQNIVSNVELGRCKNERRIKKVRSAIIYLEQSKRREREWQRLDNIEAAEVEALIPQPPSIVRSGIIVERLVSLLFEGRSEEFDALAERLDPAFAAVAGEVYLDECVPYQPAADA